MLSGDFERLAGTINSLKVLARVPSKVASIAAPRLQRYIEVSTKRGVDAYAVAFQPHAPATVKRWGAHPILNLTGNGMQSVSVRPMSGAGIRFSASDHMRFAQGGTRYEPVRAFFPNNPSLPEAWNEILELSVQTAIKQAGGQLSGKKGKRR